MIGAVCAILQYQAFAQTPCGRCIAFVTRFRDNSPSPGVTLSTINLGGCSRHVLQIAMETAEALLAYTFEHHQPHIKITDHGIRSNDWPAPSLTNEILPLFRTRWASGPQQCFNDPWHQNVVPALQLASLLFSESYPLFWFSRLTFAEHREKPGNPPRNYVKPTAYAESIEALREVKAKSRSSPIVSHSCGHVVAMERKTCHMG